MLSYSIQRPFLGGLAFFRSRYVYIFLYIQPDRWHIPDLHDSGIPTSYYNTWMIRKQLGKMLAQNIPVCLSSPAGNGSLGLTVPRKEPSLAKESPK